jgi:hypothetical protein
VNPRLPCFLGNKVGARYGAGNGIKACAPGDEIVEVDTWSTSNDAVEVVRELFCTFDALASTERTAQVVGSGVILLVELLG